MNDKIAKTNSIINSNTINQQSSSKSIKFSSLMHYPQQHYQGYHQQQYKEDPRLQRLKQDNIELQKSLQQLNECYQQKISLLEDQLSKSKHRQQALLQWKSCYIDKQLFNNAKYQSELQKMVTMMEEMARNYQKESEEMKKLLEEKEEEIVHLKDENGYLRQERNEKDQKIQGIAYKYIEEIQRLNNQLKELKDQINYEDNDVQSQFIQENQFSLQHQLSTTAQLPEENDENNQNNEGSAKQATDKQEDILKDISNQSNSNNIILNLPANQKTTTHSITKLKGQLIC